MPHDPALYAGQYLIPGEDPEEFAALCEQYLRRFPLDDPFGTFLVDSLIVDDWVLRRFRKILQKTKPDSDGFHSICRLFVETSRNYQSTLRDLNRIMKMSGKRADLKAPRSKLGSFRQNCGRLAGPHLITPPPPKTKPN